MPAGGSAARHNSLKLVGEADPEITPRRAVNIFVSVNAGHVIAVKFVEDVVYFEIERKMLRSFVIHSHIYDPE